MWGCKRNGGAWPDWNSAAPGTSGRDISAGGAFGEVPACMDFGVPAVPGLFGSHCAQSHWSISIPKYLEHLSTQNFEVSLNPGYSEHLGTQKCWSVSYPWSLDCFYSQNFGGLEDFCTQIFWGVSAPEVLGAPQNPKFLGRLCIWGHQSTLAPRIVGVSHTCGPWTTSAPKTSGVFGASLHPNLLGVSASKLLGCLCIKNLGCVCIQGPWNITPTKSFGVSLRPGCLEHVSIQKFGVFQH